MGLDWKGSKAWSRRVVLQFARRSSCSWVLRGEGGSARGDVGNRSRVGSYAEGAASRKDLEEQ
jgi:hypothetical protein